MIVTRITICLYGSTSNKSKCLVVYDDCDFNEFSEFFLTNKNRINFLQGFSMKIYAIDNGKVSAHIKDPNFNLYLPVIPSEVSSVNFTWKSGSKKYYYNFDRLQSLDESILKPPTLSIKIKGRIPQEPKGLFVLFKKKKRKRLRNVETTILFAFYYWFHEDFFSPFVKQNEIHCPLPLRI